MWREQRVCTREREQNRKWTSTWRRSNNSFFLLKQRTDNSAIREYDASVEELSKEHRHHARQTCRCILSNHLSKKTNYLWKNIRGGLLRNWRWFLSRTKFCSESNQRKTSQIIAWLMWSFSRLRVTNNVFATPSKRNNHCLIGKRSRLSLALDRILSNWTIAFSSFIFDVDGFGWKSALHT